MYLTPNEKEKYDEYIERIKESRENKKDPSEYQEHHHIIPVCVGGNNQDKNMIWLYAQEHYYAHKLLAEQNIENDKLVYAWKMMSNVPNGKGQQRKIMADQCEELKKAYSSYKSQFNKNKRLSEETKQKISKSNSGKVRTQKHKENMRKGIKEKRRDYTGQNNPSYGRILTAEEKRILSEKHNSNSGLPKGYKFSEDSKRKMSIAKKNKYTRGEGTRARKVYCIQLNMIFDCLKDGAQYVGLKSACHISDCCKGKRDTCGRHPETKQLLHWKYA